jgi:hypothetical protein
VVPPPVCYLEEVCCAPSAPHRVDQLLREDSLGVEVLQVSMHGQGPVLGVEHPRRDDAFEGVNEELWTQNYKLLQKPLIEEYNVPELVLVAEEHGQCLTVHSRVFLDVAGDIRHRHDAVTLRSVDSTKQMDFMFDYVLNPIHLRLHCIAYTYFNLAINGIRIKLMNLAVYYDNTIFFSTWT